MPDANGKLSATEKDNVRKRIDELWLGSAKNCPICGSNQWFLSDHIVEAPIITQGVRGFGAGAYPSVLLISQKCGYTLQFNAITLGVIKPLVSGVQNVSPDEDGGILGPVLGRRGGLRP